MHFFFFIVAIYFSIALGESGDELIDASELNTIGNLIEGVSLDDLDRDPEGVLTLLTPRLRSIREAIEGKAKNKPDQSEPRVESYPSADFEVDDWVNDGDHADAYAAIDDDGAGWASV
eukprot:Blabericola_migrator_1__10127@NODE_5634_length_714_cov_441_706337_g3672_i0_p1_GENE_NODE_5634_length_714_cov_441_706337_g3672_i0NODE_5634_length_714_cov_441_706337_g3672_i0_p1_ORF_typecomplete_len118_score23_35_NODE_5634_length_714_cov_441_706337_g3672_i0198551